MLDAFFIAKRPAAIYSNKTSRTTTHLTAAHSPMIIMLEYKLNYCR